VSFGYCRAAVSVAERGETVRSSALPATAKIVSFEVKSKAQKLLALAKSLLARAKSYNAAAATSLVDDLRCAMRPCGLVWVSA
jgi:hypothetical protein